jgi:c-di-GMP-binding flagellar brake protein YcgR
METFPMPLDSLADGPGGLDEFRITHPREILAMLRQLADGNVIVNLNADDGTALSSTIWSLDSARGRMSFSADADDSRTQALLECSEVVVVAYLESVKVQFDVTGLVLVRGASGSALACDFPQQLFRFQRRNAYRVRPLLSNTPLARLRHPSIADMQLALRVLDVSIGGCALFVPDDVPMLQPGALMNHVQIELDADTRFSVNLRLQHVTSIHHGSNGVRLGCEFQNPTGDALRSLQRFIDQTQKRRRMMSLD